MKKIKSIFSIICILAILFTLTGCGIESTEKENTKDNSDKEVYLETLKLRYEKKTKKHLI